jgi:hypothetical protein
VFAHWPTPQVCVPGFTFVHEPGVAPVQVSRFGSWQLASHVCVTGPAGCVGQSWLAVWHAPAPLQVAALAGTSARRRQLSPLQPAYWPLHETAPHSA